MRRTPKIPALLLLLLAGAAGMANSSCSEASSEEVASLPPAPADAVAEPPDADAAEDGGAADEKPAGVAGTLEARRRSTLSAKVGGTVAKVHVRDGDRVDEGAPLVSLDPEDFSLRRRQAAAAAEAAEAAFTAAEADWKRAKALVGDGAMPQAQFDGADARYRAAKASLTQAQVALAMARKAEADAVLKAPYAGVVVRRFISEGEHASVMPPTSLVTIEETGVYDLRVYLPPERAAGVAVGNEIGVRIPGAGTELTGKVLQVLPPASDGGTTAVLVEVPDAGDLLRPGMSAEAMFAARPVVGGEAP